MTVSEEIKIREIKSREIKSRAAVHAALGDPARLAVIDALRLSDRSPSYLGQWLGLDSNLLAHHLDVLERVGLIERIASAGDRRRRYVRLRGSGVEGLMAVKPLRVNSVLFLCTQNSARSQLAAALWNSGAPGSAESAGTHPAECVHPLAIKIAARHGIELTRAVPQPMATVTLVPDLVVTVCDRAFEELGPLDTPQFHWSIPDPAEIGTDDAFERTYHTLNHRIAQFRRAASAG